MVIATGGLASVIVPETNVMDVVDPDLTLHGLRFLYELNADVLPSRQPVTVVEDDLARVAPEASGSSLGVTGSIAAFKAVALASALTQAGALVDVMMTPRGDRADPAAQLPGDHPAPGRAVEMFGMLAETEIGHVSLGHHADVVCIAPATAHTLAKLALGLADDLRHHDRAWRRARRW